MVNLCVPCGCVAGGGRVGLVCRHDRVTLLWPLPAVLITQCDELNVTDDRESSGNALKPKAEGRF